MDGQEIEAFSAPLNKWLSATYWDDGMDGLVEWPDGDLGEIEEYGRDVITRWREPRKGGAYDTNEMA
jgi:hypothetical protein